METLWNLKKRWLLKFKDEREKYKLFSELDLAIRLLLSALNVSMFIKVSAQKQNQSQESLPFGNMHVLFEAEESALQSHHL